MQAAAITNRFLMGCSSKAECADSGNIVSSNRLLSRIIASHLIQVAHSKELFVSLASKLIPFAEQACLMRDLEALLEVSNVLMKLPIDSVRQIGLYYYALAMYRRGQRDESNALLETVAYSAPINYRARAIQTLGANYLDKGQFAETLRFQYEAMRVVGKNAHCLQTMLMAHGEIAVVRSLDGDHKRALSDLEGLWPLVYHVAKQNPFYFYLFHNELAVELGEAGRIEEAKAASQTALTCPYASAYPEWAETRRELEAKRTSATPSVVAINQTPEVIPASQVQHFQPCSVRSQPSQIRKRVFAFCWLSSRGTFHRASVTIAGFTAIVHCQTNRITLDQLGRCIKSRAPPPPSLNQSAIN